MILYHTYIFDSHHADECMDIVTITMTPSMESPGHMEFTTWKERKGKIVQHLQMQQNLLTPNKHLIPLFTVVKS